jgi:low temperature requirement protein LtrA
MEASTALREQEVRVTPLELFFDLVFVFTITQLTAVLAGEPTGEGLGQVVLMLVLIWWMYGAFLWLTNAVPPTRAAVRLLLLSGMAAFFAISLTIPTAFDGDGLIFAAAYLAVICIHMGLYMRSATWSVSGVWSFARLNLIDALLVLVGAILGGPWQYVLWGLAVAIMAVTPALVTERGGWVRAPHFVERHGLVIIVALGESVVAVGIGASHLEVTAELLAVAALGLVLAAELWWTYFGGDEEEAERALRATQPTTRAFLAVNGAFYWAHLLLLLGIIAVAAALEYAIAHAFDPLEFARALTLGGGAAAFFAGDILFRRFLGLPFRPWRAAAALIAVATIPLGTEASAFVQLAVLAGALGLCSALEGEPSGDAPPASPAPGGQP